MKKLSTINIFFETVLINLGWNSDCFIRYNFPLSPLCYNVEAMHFNLKFPAISMEKI